MTSTDRNQIAADLQLMAGGNFTPDALGPVYRETVDRVRSLPAGYLQVFKELYVARPMDLDRHADLYLANPLRILAKLQPQPVKVIVQTLLQQMSAAVATRSGRGGLATASEAVSDDTRQMLQRVDMRQRELQSLLRN
jgi:hypothetical protein